MSWLACHDSFLSRQFQCSNQCSYCWFTICHKHRFFSKREHHQHVFSKSSQTRGVMISLFSRSCDFHHVLDRSRRTYTKLRN